MEKYKHISTEILLLEWTFEYIIKDLQNLATNLDTQSYRKTVTTFHTKRINLPVTRRIKSIVNNIVISPRQVMARQFSPLCKNV